MAINTTRIATRLGSAVKVLNEVNALSTNVRQEAAVSALQTYAQQVVIQDVLADRPQTGQDFQACFAEWVRQMALVPDSFSAATCTTTVADVGTPTGTPKWVTSDLDTFGQRGDYLLPDILLLQATGTDTYSVQGKAAAPADTDASWPGGAGISTSGTLVDPADDGGAVTDPGFDSWTGSPASNTAWTIVTADVWGTGFSKVADDAYGAAGGFSLKVLSPGAQQRIRQLVSVTEGGVYALHAMMKKVVYAGGTGTVSITLRDGSGNVLSSTGISQTFTGLGTSWTAYSAVLYAPRQITTDVYLEVRWTGTAADSFYLDAVSLQPMEELYPAGLRLIGFVGVTGMVLDTDQWTATTVLDSGTITTRLAKGIDRLLGIAGNEARLPTSGSPTQDDSLIA